MLEEHIVLAVEIWVSKHDMNCFNSVCWNISSIRNLDQGAYIIETFRFFWQSLAFGQSSAKGFKCDKSQ